MKLTLIQKDILYALINLYKNGGSLAVKGEKVANLINKTPGTVRNRMQALIAIGMVEGVPGPKGGYRPTSKAYELLSITRPEESVSVPIIVNDEPTNLSAEEIVFPLPAPRQASVEVFGSLDKLNSGDRIIVGPTPVNELMLYGRIAGRDNTISSVVVIIDKILALPKDTVVEHVSSPIIAVNSDERIHNAAKTLVEKNIRQVLVREGNQVVGIFTLRHVAKAVIDGRLNAPVREFATPETIQIEKDTRIKDALRLMRDENTRILVVTDRGNPVGVITDRNILYKLANQSEFMVKKGKVLMR